MSLELALDEEVRTLLSSKDPMHNFDHIQRLKFMLMKLCKHLGLPNTNVIKAVYFHGLEGANLERLKNFFRSFGHDDDEINRLIHLCSMMKKGSLPATPEERLMHDAHVLEGGPFFTVIKSLVTGFYHDQTILESIGYFEDIVHPTQICYFPFTRKLLKQQHDTAELMIKSLKANIPLEVY